MSNPCDDTGDPHLDHTMTMFWFSGQDMQQSNMGTAQHSTTPLQYNSEDHHLQSWQGKDRVLELNTNIRSGDGQWYSVVLDECRTGQLSEANSIFCMVCQHVKNIFCYEYKVATVPPTMSRSKKLLS